MDFMSTKGNKPNNNLVLFDSLNLSFRYKHQNKINFAAEFINTIQSISNSYSAKDVVILGDWGSDWRKSIYPEYKANRQVLRDKQTEQEKQDFLDFLNEYNRAFDMLKNMYISFKFKGVEADDIIAFIAGNYADNYDHTWIISSDKDLDLLVKPNVSRFSFVTRKEVTWKNWNSHYDYNPEEHISIKVLQGDSGDNVPGVSGIGPKRAHTLLKEYGSALDIYDQLPIQSKYKYIQNLNTFGEQLLLNYDLMDLETHCNTAIGKQNCNSIMEEFE